MPLEPAMEIGRTSYSRSPAFTLKSTMIANTLMRAFKI
ncbi:hypothetical protein ID866_12987 [Astraeus odoratus]|nr:hypothetical protein ID866_12987 [Astraeus odoratus]